MCEDDKEKIVEEKTKYGEFVSSYFGWIAPEKQRKNAEKLENITKDEKKEDNNKKTRIKVRKSQKRWIDLFFKGNIIYIKVKESQNQIKGG